MSTVQISLPESVLAEARRQAERDKQTLDEFLSQAVSGHLIAVRRFEAMRERGKHVTREQFLAALGRAPDAAPIPGDELP